MKHFGKIIIFLIQLGKGKYSWKDGSCYEGDWVNGKREGFGVYYYSSGDWYEGTFVDGGLHGDVIHYFSKDGSCETLKYLHGQPV